MISQSAKLKLSVNEMGQGSILLNDIDLGFCLSSIEFKATGGELTQIKLTIMAELDAEVTADLEKIALYKDEPAARTVTTADGRVLKVR